MMIFYRATIESVLRFGITNWFGNLTVKSKAQICNLVKTAGKIMGYPPPPAPQDIYVQSVIRQANNTRGDPSHVLHSQFEMLNSGRRYRLPLCKLNRYKNSFIPQSIRLINEQLGRGRTSRRT